MGKLRQIYLGKIIDLDLSCHIFMTDTSQTVGKFEFFQHVNTLVAIKNHLIGIGYPLVGKELKMAEQQQRLIQFDTLNDFPVAGLVQVAVAGIHPHQLDIVTLKKESGVFIDGNINILNYITMEKNEMIEKMVSILASEFEVEESEITPDAKIKETLHLDSLSLVDMVALIEDEFGAKIPNADLPTIKTFADLYEYVYARQQ